MPDRFSLDSPADLMRNYNRAKDPDAYFFPEETHCRDAGDLPENLQPERCLVRRYVIEHAQTVGEMMDALNCHKLEFCEECGQTVGFFRHPRMRRAA